MTQGPATSAQAVRTDGTPGTGAVAQCYRHHGERAAASCFVCMQPICEVCTFQGLEGAVCPPCAADRKAQDKRGRLVRTVMVAVGVLVLVALGAWVKQRPDYRGEGEKVEALRAQLEQEPCDRAAAVELGDLLVGLRLYPQALELTQHYFASCPPFPRLLWVQYSAHKYGRQYDAALQDATALIESAPDDKDYWWWRGMVHELRGRLDLAVPDYRQAIALTPRLQGIPFNLAAAYKAAGQPCDAALPLQVFLLYHPRVDNAADIAERIKRILVSPTCSSHRVVATSGAGGSSRSQRQTAPIALERRTGQLRASATTGGKPFSVGMDENSGYVLLTPSAAQRLGLKTAAEKMRVKTSSGVVLGAPVELPEVTLGSVRVPRVKAVVLDDDACKVALECDGTDGWLGASLLARITLEGQADGSLMPVAPVLAP